MLHLPAQTITGVLDQMEAAGLIKRSPHPSDPRSTLVKPSCSAEWWAGSRNDGAGDGNWLPTGQIVSPAVGRRA